MRIRAKAPAAPASVWPRLIVALAIFYAAVTLWAQLRHGAWRWNAQSPIEAFTDLLAFAGLGFAALQAWRHRGDSVLRAGWLAAAGGMAIIAIGETSDWFHDGTYDWYDALPYEIVLWLLAAWLLHRCTRLYWVQRHVRYWLMAGVAVQILASLLEIAEDSGAVIRLGHFGVVRLTIEYTELLSLLCYVSALLFTQFGARLAISGTVRRLIVLPLVPTTVDVFGHAARRVVAIGAGARRAFAEQHLFRKARYPTPYRMLTRPGFRQLVTLGMIALFGFRTAPAVRRAGGPSVLAQMRDLLRLGLGQGIDAFTYYLLELYRPDARVQSDYCLTRYETKNGLFTVLNKMNGRPKDRPHQMSDKAAFSEDCALLGVATPRTLATVQRGVATLHFPRVALDRDLFVKLQRGRGTKMTERLSRIAPGRYVDRDGRETSLDQALERLRAQSMGTSHGKPVAFIIQPHLRNHPSIADLADESLIAIRIVTCINERGEPEVTDGVLRVLAKIEPEWMGGPDSEYGAAIDLATGRLGPMTGDSPLTCLAWYRNHPVTGAPVLGRRLEHWAVLRDLALKAHRGFPGRLVVGWDLALTTDGPVLLEGNANMDISFIQRCYRAPTGRSRLGVLLAMHLAAYCESRSTAGAMASPSNRLSSRVSP